MSRPQSSAPYERLARSIERELELVGEGRFDEVRALQADRSALIATLPEIPPDGARPALQRAALMSKRVEIEILRYREALMLELANVEHVGRAARGYAPPRPARRGVQATA
jgi:hypothetical protein